MVDPLEGLNDEQREAVQATHGPVLILAGAGSGKTRALTHRIAYLLRQNLAAPHEILAVTFTNKAAGEMRERVKALLGASHQTPSAISTFHSLGARILRETTEFSPRSKSFSIMDTKDSEKLIRQALQEAGLPLREFTPRSIKHLISTAKNNLHTPETYSQADHGRAAEVASLVWPRYEQLLAKHDAYDFDDLLVQSVRLLENEVSVRSALQHRWRWMNVDEYQDTNPLQEKLLQLLMGPDKNICVVGDDYQAIYSWRGAKVDHILGFEKRYPGCRVIHLTQNYRSTPQILQVAGEVITANTNQKHKKLWTQNDVGQSVEIVAHNTDRDESAWVRGRVAAHLASGGALRDCAILYRTNAQSRLLEEEFLTHHIPYTIVGGFRFYERKEVKDALGMLQWYVNPDARLPLERLASMLLTRIGPKTITRWEAEAATNSQTLREYIKTLSLTRSALRPLVRAYASIPQQANVTDILRHLLKESGYLRALRELPDGEERLENIDELLNVTSVYTDVPTFLEEVSLLTDIDQHTNADKVTCMTLHAAKGLEFPIVFIVGCEEELLPHANSIMDSAKIEEERRLLYVGITRARQTLALTYATTRYQGGQLLARTPSQFLETIMSATTSDMDGIDPLPLEEDVVYASKGEWISHPTFGRGVVIATGQQGVTCVFEGYGIKTVSMPTAS